MRPRWTRRIAALTLVSALAVAAPLGPIPRGLPAHLVVGLFEEGGEAWMRESGLRWSLRGRVLRKGWVEEEPGRADGSAALRFMRESEEQGFVPVLAFSQLDGEPSGGQGAFYAKTQAVATMSRYFGDFKLLMLRARDFGRPVVVVVEPQGFGLLQEQTHGEPQAFSAIAASGLAELAGLPDSVAGWGQAFLQLRRATGATNVLLAMPVSTWASGQDLTYEAVTAPLEPEVQKVVRFLTPLGLGANPTRLTYDLVASDPLDLDADFYRAARRGKGTWSTRQDASVSSMSFNRYAEWLRLFNTTTGKRWLLWQVPLGSAPTGRAEPHAEYFFGEHGEQHRQRFADAGVLALLFGHGRDGLTAAQVEDERAQRGSLAKRAGPYLASGGLALPGGPVASGPEPTGRKQRPVPEPEPEEAEEAAAPPAGAPRPAQPPPAPAPIAKRPAKPEPSLPQKEEPPAAPPLPFSPGAAPARPDFTATTMASPADVGPHAVSTLRTVLRNRGGDALDAEVTLEISDEGGAVVARQRFVHQRFRTDQVATFTWPWRAPAQGGTYSVGVGVSGPNQTPSYLWQRDAATVTVGTAAAATSVGPSAGSGTSAPDAGPARAPPSPGAPAPKAAPAAAAAPPPRAPASSAPPPPQPAPTAARPVPQSPPVAALPPAPAPRPAVADAGTSVPRPPPSAVAAAAPARPPASAPPPRPPPSPSPAVRTPGPAAPALAGDVAQYGFESGAQGWGASGPSARVPFPSSAQVYAGARSLAVSFTGARGTASVRVRAPTAAAGRTVTFHVWLPEGNNLDSIQAYVQEGPAGRWRYTAAWRDARRLTPGAWSAVEVAVPADAATPLLELGVEFRARGGWTGTAYLDSVRW